MSVIPLTIAIIILLLYLSFKRFSEVFIIVATIPFSIVGGILLLSFLNYHFSVAVAVGFIALAGVAVEISILMLVYLNQAWDEVTLRARKENRSLEIPDLKAAIIAGTLMRVRPIVMTVSAIIVGLLPIMLGHGTGSEVMRRIAAPMVGGMITATILSLLVIPAVFLLWKKRILGDS